MSDSKAMSWDALAFGSVAGGGGVRVVRELDTLRAGLDRVRCAGHRIALVPTMGNLHDGHLALVRRACELCEIVVASIFVNPYQFGAGEDFDSYPRTFEQDLVQLEHAGCQLVFAPDGDTVYPHGPDTITRVQVPGLGDVLDGESRPGFFRGVATVVNILFNMVEPDVAMFGEKDFQQLLVVRRMVADLHLRVRVESVATVREPDGLAMSSRNGYLTHDERARAPVIYRALLAARDSIAEGETDLGSVEAHGLRTLEEAGLEPDYFKVCRRADLAPPEPSDRELVVLAAARLGSARLIDNIQL